MMIQADLQWGQLFLYLPQHLVAEIKQLVIISFLSTKLDALEANEHLNWFLLDTLAPDIGYLTCLKIWFLFFPLASNFSYWIENVLLWTGWNLTKCLTYFIHSKSKKGIVKTAESLRASAPQNPVLWLA